MLNREEIEVDYKKIKSEFRNEDNLLASNRIVDQLIEHEKILKEVFGFLISAFKGKLRNDKKTPLVFHSIYMVKLLYACGEKDLDSLLTTALHDVLEDTDVSEEDLMRKDFMEGKEHLLNYLKTLSEDKTLSREPDGENLPPRYVEHVKRLIGAPREVVNTEILDRFSDLMDLEYITDLPQKEKELRLKSKLIKVKSFVENITGDRNDFNKNCLELFESKMSELETEVGVKINVPKITP